MSEEPRILVYEAFTKERNKGNPAGVVCRIREYRCQRSS